MFFRRRIIQKPPIEIADMMVRNAMIIAYGYLHNKRNLPTQEELAMFESFVEELDHSRATAAYISRCLYQRSRGEPEGSPKFTNPDSFDYHFPK